MFALIQPIVPVAAEAFLDYNFQSLHLSRLEVQALRTGQPLASDNKRENAEWEEKRKKLKLRKVHLGDSAARGMKRTTRPIGPPVRQTKQDRLSNASYVQRRFAPVPTPAPSSASLPGTLRASASNPLPTNVTRKGAP